MTIAFCDPATCPAAGCTPTVCTGAGVPSNHTMFERSRRAIPGCGPAGWAIPVPLMFETVRPAALSFSVTPVPAAKLMPSWHAPHASALGTLRQLSPSFVLVVREIVLDPSWHDVQLRMSCG